MDLKSFRLFVRDEFGSVAADAFELQIAQNPPKSYRSAFGILANVSAGGREMQPLVLGKTNSPAPKVKFHNKRPKNKP